MIKARFVICLFIWLNSFCAFSQIVEQKPYNKRILVVGGGGARGAWGAGFAHHLTIEHGPYSKAFGTSTGSLMIPLIVLNDFDSLKKGYTSVNQKSIFNVNPFNKKTGELKILKAIWRTAIGKKTFGESRNLKGTMKAFLSEDKYKTIIDSKENLEFIVTVVDFKTGIAEYKSSKDHNYEQMIDWMWASGNEPLFMSYYNVGEHAYVDGGVMENVPLKYALSYALESGYRDIDVIINKPEDPIIDKEFNEQNILKGLNRLIEFFTLEIRNDDLHIPKLKAELENYRRKCNCPEELSSPDSNISLKFYYFPKEYFNKINSKELLFDKGRMEELWNIGYSGKSDGKDALVESSPIIIPKVILKELLRNL